MRISDWSSDVCSSDLVGRNGRQLRVATGIFLHQTLATLVLVHRTQFRHDLSSLSLLREHGLIPRDQAASFSLLSTGASIGKGKPNSRSSSRASSSDPAEVVTITSMPRTVSMRSQLISRSEEHTSELQSLMRIS